MAQSVQRQCPLRVSPERRRVPFQTLLLSSEVGGDPKVRVTVTAQTFNSDCDTGSAPLTHHPAGPPQSKEKGMC